MSTVESAGAAPRSSFNSFGRPTMLNRSSNQGSKTFETLLIEAWDRQAAERAAVPQGAETKPWVRPAGALGVNSLSSEPTGPGLTPGAVLGSGAATGPVRAVGGSMARSAAGEAVIDAASKYLGVPYLWGGTDPDKGFDCSGLIQHAYRDIGVEMPKWSRHQATMGVEVPSIEDALPGDILAFGEPVNHVSLYVGDGKMLHAPKTGDVVRVGPIDREIVTIRRIVAPGAGQVGAPYIESGIGSDRGSTSGTSAVGVPGAATPVGHTPSEAERLYQPLFESAGRRWDVDPALLAAVAKTESAFNPNAVSHVGAQGLMQFMPATAAEMGVDAFDPASAIDGAARYLRTSLDQFGSSELAIASYNAGRGAVSRHGDIPPYTETQNYVRKVMDAWRSRS